ncbi:MAG TPA: methyltransferase [Acidimicrobiales bacterium]|jgi:protein-S-isoprenylcysteine O-methyltransferase Ste14|nr:methyltransferase [Acidimicrobiales bacterium]
MTSLDATATAAPHAKHHGGARAVPVAVFGSLVVVAAAHLGVGHPSLLEATGRGAYLVVLVLQVWAFATQPPPEARDGRLGVWVVTLVATFAMVVAPSLPALRSLWAPGRGEAAAQAALGLVGSGLAVAAMARLGRSFSLTPQVRALATGGAYRLVRHPLYLGEALNVAGLAVVAGSLTVVVAAVVVVAGEVARAVLEERLLRCNFADYERRFGPVAHLVPGVW